MSAIRFVSDNQNEHLYSWTYPRNFRGIFKMTLNVYPNQIPIKLMILVPIFQTEITVKSIPQFLNVASLKTSAWKWKQGNCTLKFGVSTWLKNIQMKVDRSKYKEICTQDQRFRLTFNEKIIRWKTKARAKMFQVASCLCNLWYLLTWKQKSEPN